MQTYMPSMERFAVMQQNVKLGWEQASEEKRMRAEWAAFGTFMAHIAPPEGQERARDQAQPPHCLSPVPKFEIGQGSFSRSISI